MQNEQVKNKNKEPQPLDIFWVYLTEEAIRYIASRFREKKGTELVILKKTSDTLQVGSVFGITRQDLKIAGVHFLNRVSRDNEKPLLAGEIIIKEKLFDLSDFAFFTEEELEQIKKLQSMSREARGVAIDFELARKYALLLFEKVTTFHNSKNKQIESVVILALEELKKELSEDEMKKINSMISEKDHDAHGLTLAEKSYISMVFSILIDNISEAEITELNTVLQNDENREEYFGNISDIIINKFPYLSENKRYLVQILAEILPKNTIRDWKTYLGDVQELQQRSESMSPGLLVTLSGVDTYQTLNENKARIHTTPTRFGILANNNSPFVTSDFVFSENPDVTVTFDNGEQRRINKVVEHLWTEDLDEQGGEGDQIYFTVEEFTKLFTDIENLQTTLVDRINIDKVKTYLTSRIRRT